MKNLTGWLPYAVYNNIYLQGGPVNHDSYKTSERSAISVQYNDTHGVAITINTDFCGPASLIDACCSDFCRSVSLPSWNSHEWIREGIPPRIQQVEGIALKPNSTILTYYASDYFDYDPSIFKCAKCASTMVEPFTP